MSPASLIGAGFSWSFHYQVRHDYEHFGSMTSMVLATAYEGLLLFSAGHGPSYGIIAFLGGSNSIFFGQGLIFW